MNDERGKRRDVPAAGTLVDKHRTSRLRGFSIFCLVSREGIQVLTVFFQTFNSVR
jgi:hypothetical protein